MASGVLDQLKDEIASIKGGAVGAMLNILWGMVKQAPLPAAPPIQRDKPKRGSQSSIGPRRLQPQGPVPR